MHTHTRHSPGRSGWTLTPSAALGVCRGLSLKRGSDESIFRRARRWVRTQPRRRLWPFARRDQESSTQIKVEQQLVEDDPCLMSRSEGPVSHTTEGQGRPEVSVATWVSGEPGPVGGWRTPPPKMPRLHKPRALKPLSPDTRRAISKYVLELYGPLNDTRPEDREPMEAEAAPPDAEPASTTSSSLSSCSCGARLTPDETEAPAPLEEEPSLEPVLAPASEEELPVEGPAQGPLSAKG
ncbi:hypothetical protein QTO34_005674 [Cnephaeus nilssonii]|uniref:Uncharacterized protein n=1 Tax=Cnephaeus nilssonii TaxID=3371016 RepID=A0AA40LIC2_CNENI|nr:hypothetical protein QTO34_005674 [Eptesicus nilssonii]